jgi:hypothetical protein
MRLVAEAKAGDTQLSRDPKLAKEFTKHQQLEHSRQSDSVDLHARRLAKIHQLMKSRNLDFNTAFNEVCKEENSSAESKEAQASYDHIESIARGLMARDGRLTFGKALEIVRTCLPSVQREIAAMLRSATDSKPKAEPAGRVEAGSDDYQPHPGLASAMARGQLLIEGGFATPILPKVKG